MKNPAQISPRRRKARKEEARQRCKARLIEPEIDLDGCFYGHGLAVERARLKFPAVLNVKTADSSRPYPKASNDFHVRYRAVFEHQSLEQDKTLNTHSASRIGVEGMGLYAKVHRKLTTFRLKGRSGQDAVAA